jgi:formylglycine-generating enzyme required for sulfatase activity
MEKYYIQEIYKIEMKQSPILTLFALLLFFCHNGFAQGNLTFTINGVSFNMIYVEGGSFVMGCTQEQGNCFQGETPTHTVTLSDFFMGELEVTQKLWQAVMGTTIRHQWLAHSTRNRKAFQRQRICTARWQLAQLYGCRISSRYARPANQRVDNYGFRLVLRLDDEMIIF